MATPTLYYPYMAIYTCCCHGFRIRMPAAVMEFARKVSLCLVLFLGGDGLDNIYIADFFGWNELISYLIGWGRVIYVSCLLLEVG